MLEVRCSHAAALFVMLLAGIPACAQNSTPDVTAVDPKEVDTTDGALRKTGLAVNTVGNSGIVTTQLRKSDKWNKGEALAKIAAFNENSVLKKPNCFLRVQDWVDSVDGFSKSNGWKPPSPACASSKVAEDEPEMRDMHNTFVAVGNLLEDVMKNILDTVSEAIPDLKSKWGGDDAYQPNGHVFDARFHKCTIETSTGVRVKSTTGGVLWYFLLGVSNEPQDKTLADRKRLYITEYVGVNAENSTIDPLPSTALPFGATDPKETSRKKYPTIFQEWGGSVGVSGVLEMPISDAPALKRAMEAVNVDANQLEDAVTASNIAILALPLALALIPARHFFDVNTRPKLLLSTLNKALIAAPFLTKGIELLVMGGKTYRALESWYRGRSGDSIVVLETWSAECKPKLHVFVVGAVFVSVDLFVLAAAFFIDVYQFTQRKNASGASKKDLAYVEASSEE